MTTTDRPASDVQGAMRRSGTNRTGFMDLTVDAPRNWLTVRLIEAFDDRAILAAEVERLQQENAVLHRQQVRLLGLPDDTTREDSANG